ncbi:MAG: ACP phosphodiesterase [Chitinophagaceae bacterium]
MNYLAHAFLSFNHEEILVGNMISDFVKGKRKFDYDENIQKGIHLHRKIDHYTDQHLANKELKLIFKPYYGLYSGAIMDVLYDHFLANDETYFTEKELLEFSQRSYDILDIHCSIFPERFALMFPSMKKHDWFFHYRFHEGIRQSLGGLQRRAKYIFETDTAFRLFNEHYETLQAGYHDFFPDLLEMTRSTYQELI